MRFIYSIKIEHKLKGLANSFGGHWGMRANEAKKARNKIGIRISNAIQRGSLSIPKKGKLKIIFTRHLGGRMKWLDQDNLGSAFKHVQDAVTRAIGIDDGNRKRLEFSYAQQVDTSKLHTPHISIEIWAYK